MTRADLTVGACRARKMRCVLDPDDSRGRCVACIRLKKTCAFYPPEQKQGRTDLVRTSDKARPTVDTSGEGSSSFAGESLECAPGGGEQLDSSTVPSSAASFASTESLYASWSVPPDSLECTASGFDSGSTLPFWPQPSLPDGLDPWEQPGSLSHGSALRQGDEIPGHHSLFNFVAPTEGSTLTQMDVAAGQPYQCDTSVSSSLWTAPFDQTNPPASHVNLLASSVTAGQCDLQEPLQSRNPSCELVGRNESIARVPTMADIRATHEQANAFYQEASVPPLALDGDLYRRRGRSLIALALKACGRQID